MEVLLPPEACTQFRRGAISQETLRPLADTIRRLSDRYVSRRGVTPLTLEEATAYALYYTLVNGAKIHHLLKRGSKALIAPARILDYGCGPGTASLVASYLFDSPAITAVDSAPAMRDVATRLLTARAAEKPLQWEVGSTFTGQFDLIIAANMLNELSPPEGLALIAKLVEALTPNGCLLTVEPALFETTRAHMALRDATLARFPELTILFPCTHGAPCPMLTRSETEWCHAPLPWNEPRLVRQIDTLTGFNKHRPKYSAFIFGRATGPADGLRIIRAAEKSAKGTTALVCGPQIYGELTLLKRHKTEANRLFQRAEAFDRIVVNPPPERGSIDPEAQVELSERNID